MFKHCVGLALAGACCLVGVSVHFFSATVQVFFC